MPATLSRLVRLAALTLAIATAPAATAHEFWIEPSDFRPAVGEVVTLTLRVGTDLVGDSVPYIRAWIRRYFVVAPDRTYPVVAVIGDEPAGELRADTPGLYVIAYESTQDLARMNRERFRYYVEREGLEHIAGTFAAALEPDRIVRDHYYRYAKALLVAGSPARPTPGFDRVLGFEIELVPERNPLEMRPDDRLPVRLLYRGKPLADTLVNAYRQARPREPVSARTDAAGRVELLLPDSGMWLLNATHLRPPAAGDDADWESVWASLSFELPAD